MPLDSACASTELVGSPAMPNARLSSVSANGSSQTARRAVTCAVPAATTSR
jgi:hypothetical protein